MKPSTLVALVAQFTGLVQGCVRVHAYLSNTPIGNDIMSIELWDDDSFYRQCGTCSWAFASNESRCRKECGKFTVEVWNNGRSAWVRNNDNNGLVYTMRQTNSDTEDYCCLMTDNGCRGWCSNWESCHKSQHDNCRRYACNLCDAAFTTAAGLLHRVKGGATKPYEEVHQAEFALASILDLKQYDRLGERMMDDVVYDSRPLGAYGGLSVGLEQTRDNIKAAFGDAMHQHQVINALIDFTDDTYTTANVSTYLTWSRWDPTALHDITKTFRIFERCDDVFVVDPKDGRWKLKYSVVVNMGPKVEAPYFNDGQDTCQE